jgi:hypothetical protein
MVERAYVVDIAVEDIDAAARRFEQILGIEPLVTDHYDPSGQMRQRHFAVGGLNAIGLQSVPTTDSTVRNYVARRLLKRGEGAYLIGFLVNDVTERQAALEEQGVEFALREPVSYEAGRMTMTRPFNSTVVEFAQHYTPDETAKWQALAKAAAGRRVRHAHIVDLAVEDLGAVRATVEKAFGAAAVPGADVAEPLPGDGIVIPTDGLYGVGLTVLGASEDPRVQPDGEGIYCLGFVVDDLDAMQQHLEHLGIGLLYDRPREHALGRLNITTPVHGVLLQLSQHDPSAAARWRSLAGH